MTKPGRMISFVGRMFILSCPTLSLCKQISLSTLLNEMIDREQIASLPDPQYQCKQASSRTMRLTKKPRLFCRCLTVCFFSSMISMAWANVPAQSSDLQMDSQDDWLLNGSQYQASLTEDEDHGEIVLSNGLLRRRFRLSPNAATVGFDNLITGQSIIRGVKPEAEVEIDGKVYQVGGLVGQPNYAFLTEAWTEQLRANPAAMTFVGYEAGLPEERITWNEVRHHHPDVVWPPKGVYLRMDYRMPRVLSEDVNIDSPANSGQGRKRLVFDDILVSVHYELYSGIPAISKWITVANKSNQAIVVNRFKSEILAAVEYSASVEEKQAEFPLPNIHVETEYAFGSMSAGGASQATVHWVADPDYLTQVNYARQNPCLLEVGPDVGPDQTIAPGETFESFRAFILPFDSYDRERNGLAVRKMYRTVAPWVTENPLMMHVRYADWKAVKTAIDQCAEVGFEMVILTFGSGFNIENDSAEYLAKMTDYVKYAKSKGIEIGGYSLLASRRVGGGHDVVMPEGQRPKFGNSPCLESQWGQDYFAKLYAFYRKTGFNLLEHDGSYPGDVCLSTEHPGHQGYDDSQWNQWRMITDFYKFCRANGVYLNVPDFYYLAGSNKSGMGYRETNWSLPRAQQVIHTRQNIFDGTWAKTPSMGWMFVPLTQYHGGGEAATIEPLKDHLNHYELMMASNLGAGVQACYRGPRLYDTDETKDLVKKWVSWYKKYRRILEGDIIHLRRADGKDLDYWLHVDPAGREKGLLMVFNPLDRPVSKQIGVPLYYTGLDTTAKIREGDAEPKPYPLARDYSVSLDVDLAARGLTWFVIE